MSVPTRSNKILIALQYYAGDRELAMQQARLIADLEPSFSEAADFLFMSRFDCKHDAETIKQVSRKFRCQQYRCRRRGVGWPIGPNELFFGLAEYVYHKIEAGQIPHYKAFLAFEADCVPLSRSWIAQLSNAWDEAQKRKLTFVAGALVQYPEQHVNGNMMLSGDLKFLHWLAKKIGGSPPATGWDFYLRAAFAQWGQENISIMRSHWGSKTCPDEVLGALIHEGVVFLHGIKDDSALKYSRKLLLGS